MTPFSSYLEQLGLSQAEASALCPLERSQKLAKAQFLKAAFDELAASDTAITPIDAAHAITWLRRCGELQRADSFFQELEPTFKYDPRVLLEYIFVLVAAGRFDDAEKTLSYFIGTGYDKYTSLEKLLVLAPFASNEALSDLTSRIILGQTILRKESWLHSLYELTERRGLHTAASTLLEVYRGAAFQNENHEEALCFQSNLAFQRGNFVEQNHFLSEVFASYGLVSTRLKIPDRPVSVLNLETSPPATIEAKGPLVSILIATYNTAATIDAVCRSLLAQSYENLELLIVDDASTDATRDIIQRLAETDARVRFFALEKNQGTYTAFNHGLGRAKGDLVTCQGADDWAHPEKIATLVSALLENPKAIASKARKVRCAESDGLQSSPTGYATQDISSLTYWRDPVKRELGFYDPVRCSADAEFLHRLQYRFGTDSIVRLPAVTGVCDWSSNGLTGGQRFTVLGPFASPARTEYHRCFRAWHEKARLSGDLYIPFPQRTRKFPAPADVLPHAPSA